MAKKLKLRTKEEINTLLRRTAAGVVTGVSEATAHELRRYIKSKLYAPHRFKSKYYERTYTFPKTVSVRKSAPRATDATIFFDLEKLEYRDPVFSTSSSGKESLIQFGAHVDINGNQVDDWFPILIDEGWDVLGGHGRRKVKHINGINMFKHIEQYTSDLLSRIASYKNNRYEINPDMFTGDYNTEFIFNVNKKTG